MLTFIFVPYDYARRESRVIFFLVGVFTTSITVFTTHLDYAGDILKSHDRLTLHIKKKNVMTECLCRAYIWALIL